MTTGVALACGLAVWQGVGTLAYSFGMLLSLLNVTGRLRFVQTRKTRPKCFYVAWGLLLVSLFLPAANGCNGNHMLGWETAWVTAWVEVGVVASMFDPQDDSPWHEALLLILWLGTLNLANIFLLLSPLLLYMWQRDRWRWTGNALAFFALNAWLFGWGSEYLIGYYLWCLVFAVILVTHRLRWRTFAVLVAYFPLLFAVAFAVENFGPWWKPVRMEQEPVPVEAPSEMTEATSPRESEAP